MVGGDDLFKHLLRLVAVDVVGYDDVAPYLRPPTVAYHFGVVVLHLHLADAPVEDGVDNVMVAVALDGVLAPYFVVVQVGEVEAFERHLVAVVHYQSHVCTALLFHGGHFATVVHHLLVGLSLAGCDVALYRPGPMTCRQPGEQGVGQQGEENHRQELEEP